MLMEGYRVPVHLTYLGNVLVTLYHSVFRPLSYYESVALPTELGWLRWV